MAGITDGEDLKEALTSRVPYSLLSVSLQQRYSMSEYHDRVVKHSILHIYAYYRLPEYVRAGLSEAAYYAQMIEYGGENLQLYPYVHQKRILLYTKKTQLSYYLNMLLELLKKEQNYDQLPNFTALDILRLLRIGRNQFLNITKEVRSKLRWHTNRNYITEHLPTMLASSVEVKPFWRVLVVEKPVDQVRRACQLHAVEDYTLYQLLFTNRNMAHVSVEALQAMGVQRSLFLRDTIFACELPKSPLLRLYRKGFVSFDFNVSPDDRIVVPPLEDFVMNRTCDDPHELLLYRVMSTSDDRTPLHLLSQLLMLDVEDVCAAAHVLVRLGLALLKSSAAPAKNWKQMQSIHPTWGTQVQEMVRLTTSPKLPTEMFTSYGSPIVSHDHPLKRIALLYDVTLTGFLMTNLSRDPAFKRHAVTLFEVGKMPDELVESFLVILGGIDLDEEQVFGDEVLKYIRCVFCLRETLKVLRSIRGPEGAAGVDLLKIESLNELEATTRYSVLGRNYWSYITIAPLANVPLIDIELSGVYGNTASLMASPWLLLYLHSKTRCGPPSLFIPFGSFVQYWPPLFDQDKESDDMVEEWPAFCCACSTSCGSSPSSGSDSRADIVVGRATKLRLQSIALDSEVSYVDLNTSLPFANEMALTSPVLVQCAVSVPLVRKYDGSVSEVEFYHFNEVDFPFTATREEVMKLANKEIAAKRNIVNNSANTEASAQTLFVDTKDELYVTLQRCIEALHLEHSLGYITCCLGYCTGDSSEEAEPTTHQDPMMLNRPQGGDHNDGVPLLNAEELPSTRKPCLVYTLDTVQVVGIGFGVPLTSLNCCLCMLPGLHVLLSEESTEKHNAAMRSCVEEFSLFMEQHSSLKRLVYEKLPIQSVSAPRSTTQMHLRKVCSQGGALPFPRTFLFFDGTNLRTVDDADPLSEFW
ncbi:unnamed protein product [Phytomonas sp. Hart1]|nr:unnamed protein product [Phytomonas sp. Hart1]|eukprot:CCW70250.1 unnamed protein product [Phytomonas sp. isolate Hart1]